jgi:enoyl-CoA hydratase/carnithine racemase
MGPYEHLLVKRDGDTVRITMNRAQRRNTLTEAHLRELLDAFETAGRGDATGIVLAGEGPVFCAGHDFADVAGRDLAGVRDLVRLCTRTMRTIQAVPQVVVARVHAIATAAGCQLVASCDLAVAAESASFALPGGKGGWFCHTPAVPVARSIGRKRLMELALTGDPIDAERGFELGLVNRLTDPGQALEAALELAETIAANGPLALRATKRILVESADWPDAEFFSRQREIAGPVMSSEDAREGATAFAEKRPPIWKGR